MEMTTACSLALRRWRISRQRLVRLSFFCFAFSVEALAVDVFVAYTDGCEHTAGSIVNVNEDEATFLTFSGELKKVKTTGVDFIARYSVLENPFSRIVPDTITSELLEITSESTEGSFRAFAVNFFDDLVLFLDEYGKIRVIEFNKIISIKKIDHKLPFHSLSAKTVKLVSPPGKSECRGILSREHVQKQQFIEHVATQIISDKIRIDSFFTNMRTGFRNLASLRERTLFYSRPIMYDQKTRLGITSAQSNRSKITGLASAASFDLLPLYLEFGSGSAYRFQSHTVIGNQTAKHLPIIKPMGTLQSEFKSHLIHGAFIANLSGFTAGSSIYKFSWNENLPATHPWLDMSFNHMTLLGADYAPYSLSFGYYFPVFAMGKDDEYREIVSPESSPVMQVGYKVSDWSVDLLYYSSTFSGSGDAVANAKNPDRRFDTINFFRYYSQRFVPKQLKLNANFVRINFDWQIKDNLLFGNDLLFGEVNYSETALRRDNSLTGILTEGEQAQYASGFDVKNKFSHSLLGNRTLLRMDIGKWVALRAEACFEYVTSSAEIYEDLSNSNSNKKSLIETYIGGLELLL